MGIEKVDQALADVLETLPGWMTLEKARRVARLISSFGPDHAPLCVELGVFGGRGVITLGLAVKHCLNGNGAVDGIDPYTAAAALEGTSDQANHDWWAKLNYQDILAAARGGIERLGLQEIVTLRLHRSQDVVEGYEDHSIDLLHQDSNHSEEISCYEVATWTPKIRRGGLWVFDDIDWPSTRLAQSQLKVKGFTLLEDHGKWAVYSAP